MPFVFNPFTGELDGIADPIDDAFTFPADCSASEGVGDCVYVSSDLVSGVIQVRKADVTDSSKMPSIGIILYKPTTTTCIVVYLGAFPVGVLPSFLPGKKYYVGASSKPVSVTPTAPAIIQIVGIALDSGRLLFNPSPSMVKVT